MAVGRSGQRHRSHPPTLAERMVCPPWAAVLGSRTRVDADNRTTTNPLTGEPDAGDPPVRFGGRGGANPAIPTSIERRFMESSHFPVVNAAPLAAPSPH